MSNRKIHFAGAIRTARMRVLPGWAACCHGTRADEIRRLGLNTYIAQLVTCKSCLRLIKAHNDYAELKAK
jgi:hypothetical protein